jgi:glutamine amidotransferase
VGDLSQTGLIYVTAGPAVPIGKYAAQALEKAGVPILGICLGMQQLAESSEEFGRHEGLGLIRGEVVRLQPSQPGERVPNIGWCDVATSAGSRLFGRISSGGAFYFMHSYRLACTEARDVAGTIVFGGTPACAAVERGNIFGVQFHPEKSQDLGLHCLYNFLSLTTSRESTGTKR